MEPIRSARINPAGRRLDSTIEGLGVTAPPAMIAEKWGETVVAYGAFVPHVRVARLERVSRFAGEAFGHEEAASAPRRRGMALFQNWAAWLLAALVVVVGLATLSLR